MTARKVLEDFCKTFLLTIVLPRKQQDWRVKLAKSLGSSEWLQQNSPALNLRLLTNEEWDLF